MKSYEILIIGGGPAAITIAKNIQDKKKIGIIRPEDHSMIYCAMPYAIEKLIPFQKTLKSDRIVEETGAELIRDRAVSVDFNKKIVKLEKNDSLKYEKLIIATGARPILPNIKGVDLNGVMTFKTQKDLEKILKKVENGLQKAVVVGAGAIGIELSQALNKRGLETHLVDMQERILPNLMDYEMIEEPEEQLIKDGVNLHLSNKVSEIKGTETVEKVILGCGQEINFTNSDDCSVKNSQAKSGGLVVFAIGMQPNVEIFQSTGLEIRKAGIVVNEKMETNLPNVFAVGDVVQFHSGITQKITGGKLATNAVPMGRIVANNILGKSRSYKGFYNGAATKVGNYYTGGTGLTEKIAEKSYEIAVGYANFTTAFPMMPNAEKIKLKLIADKKTHKILGGQFVSGKPVTDKVDKVTMAIQYGITLKQLLDFSYSSQPFQSFFPAHNLIVKAAEEILKQID